MRCTRSTRKYELATASDVFIVVGIAIVIAIGLLPLSMPSPPHPLASIDQILETPSRRDGIPEELENDLRVVGCQLIQESGVLLKL